MAAQTQGIQQLLVAEKRAAEKINEARKRKQKRLKQAKEEAQAEVEKYKAEREATFAEYEKTHLGNKDDVAARIDQDTQTQLANMTKTVAANKDKVIQDLLMMVTKIEPKVHQNLRPDM